MDEEATSKIVKSQDIRNAYKNPAKVAPLDSSLSAPPRKSVTISPHARFRLVRQYDEPSQTDDVKCQFKVFILVVGLLLLALGTALAIYGNKNKLRDFLIIGPGCLVIGITFIVTCIVLTCRDVIRRYQRGTVWESESKLSPDFQYRAVVDARQRAASVGRQTTPGVRELYGGSRDRPSSGTSQSHLSQITASDLKFTVANVSETGKSHTHLPALDLTLPERVGRDEMNENISVYTIPVKSIPDREEIKTLP